ncbi:MAG TPA: hypothetical protein PKD73_12265 [Burkholderiaceae bacterium]|jgi:hypothetical protein|nr:hypothetical protein [Burkholderiaceae bacterium]
MKKYQTEFKLEVVKSFLVIGVNYLGRGRIDSAFLLPVLTCCLT